MHSYWFSALLLALCLVPCLSAATITALDHDAFEGAVSELDNQLRLQITRNDGTKIGIELDSIESVDYGRRIEPAAPTSAPFRVVLLDGTTLIGKILPSDEAEEGGELFCVESLRFGKLLVDVFDVARIERRQFEPASTDAPATDEETELQDVRFKAYKPDGKSYLCDLEGVRQDSVKTYIDGIDDEGGRWRNWEEYRSLVLRADEAIEPATELIAIISTDRGERLVGAIDSWEGGTLKVASDFLTSQTAQGLVTLSEEHIVDVVFKNGRFVYLSDMQPSKVREYPYFRSTDFEDEDYLFGFRNDQAQGGGPLVIAGKRYAKGLGVHSISHLTYRTDRRFTKFIATIGVDDSAGELASVTFKLLVDGKEAKMEVLQSVDGEMVSRRDTSSGVIRKVHGALRVEVDVAGASEITLVVEAADNADVNDRANWANAKLVR